MRLLQPSKNRTFDQKNYMNRKEFIRSVGAEFEWDFAWSFIRPSTKTVIFPAWDVYEKNGVCKILSEDWQYNPNGHRSGKYNRALNHIFLVEKEGWNLNTFVQIKGGENKAGAWKIARIVPHLNDRRLVYIGPCWFAVDARADSPELAEELNRESVFPEGAKSQIVVNAYERNKDARAECLSHHGRSCAVCDFNFGKEFGDLGEGFIHVHHRIPISTSSGINNINPIDDLIPVCPNCHAMLHRTADTMAIEDLKELRARVKNDREE